MNKVENLSRDINEYFRLYLKYGFAGGFMFSDEFFNFACDQVDVKCDEQEKMKIKIKNDLENIDNILLEFVSNKEYEPYQNNKINMDSLCFLSEKTYMTMRNYFSPNQLLGETVEGYYKEAFEFIEKNWSSETAKLLGLPESFNVWPENNLQRKKFINEIEKLGIDCSNINYADCAARFNHDVMNKLKKLIDVGRLFNYIAVADSNINNSFQYGAIQKILSIEEKTLNNEVTKCKP